MEPKVFRSMAEQRRHEWLLQQRNNLIEEQTAAILQEDLMDAPRTMDEQPCQTMAFDVDGCLFDEYDQPRWDVIDILRAFSNLGWAVSVWSGSGVEYAKAKVNRLGLMPLIVGVGPKGGYRPDVAFDDQDVTLGKANIRI